MHRTGWYIHFRIVFTPSFEHEISNLVYNEFLVSLEKKIGAIVSWVLHEWRLSVTLSAFAGLDHPCSPSGTECQLGCAARSAS